MRRGRSGLWDNSRVTAISRGRRRRAFRTLATLTTAVALTVAGVIAAAGPTHSPRPAAATHRSVRTTPSPTPGTPTPGTPTPTSPWVLVSLGDSVPAGSACGCRPFPQLYAGQIGAHTGAHVTVRNNGMPGETSGGLREALRSSTALRSDVAAAQVITVTIGANDFAFSTYRPGGCSALRCYRGALAQLGRNLDAILATIGRLAAARLPVVRVTGYWEIWRDGEVGRRSGATYMRVGDELTRLVNHVISEHASAHGAVYVDLYRAFHGLDGDRDDTSLLAADGDHPSRAGHELIGALLFATGLAPLL